MSATPVTWRPDASAYGQEQLWLGSQLRTKTKDITHQTTLGLADDFLLLIIITLLIICALLWPVVDLASRDDARLLIT